MIVHYVGNKSRDEGVSFSEKELDYTDISSDITSMLVKSFDTKEPCHFYFESTLALNPIYTFAKEFVWIDFYFEIRKCWRHAYW